MQKIFLTDGAGIATVARAVGCCDFSSRQGKYPAQGVMKVVEWQGNSYGALGKR